MNSIKLNNLSGKNLIASLNDEDANKSVELNKDYIDKKLQDFFGKKLILTFSKSNSNSNNEEEEKSGNSLNQKNQFKKETSSNDPVINAIIEELGGKEIA